MSEEGHAKSRLPVEGSKYQIELKFDNIHKKGLSSLVAEAEKRQFEIFGHKAKLVLFSGAFVTGTVILNGSSLIIIPMFLAYMIARSYNMVKWKEGSNRDFLETEWAQLDHRDTSY
ncbi:MAG: hypothetical protein WC308_04630 [archaeon]|jgi:hypothetical protein